VQPALELVGAAHAPAVDEYLWGGFSAAAIAPST
jgi:hypothetical protein